MPTTDLPATLAAVASYLRDACDGPDDGADACETAAAIVRAACDPAFVEATRSSRHTFRQAARGAFSAEHATIWTDHAEAIGRLLALIAPGEETR